VGFYLEPRRLELRASGSNYFYKNVNIFKKIFISLAEGIIFEKIQKARAGMK
jgi:hypothetical protein